MENEYQSIVNHRLPRRRSLFNRRCTAVNDWLKSIGVPSRVAAMIVTMLHDGQVKSICEDEKLEIPQH